MEAHSQETLCRVQQNDAELKTLLLCIRHDAFVSPYNESGGFPIDDNNLLSKLGLAIGESSHLDKHLVFLLTALSQTEDYLMVFDAILQFLN